MSGIELKTPSGGSVTVQPADRATNETLTVPSGNGTVALQGDIQQAIDDNVIGVNQTWQDVTASRAEGVTYTNTTGRPIVVCPKASDAGDPNYGSFVIDGHYLSWGGGQVPTAVQYVIPHGSTYSWSSPSSSLQTWLELR